jgi:hypothetical protein
MQEARTSFAVSPIIESLESRTLLSATPTVAFAGAVPATVLPNRVVQTAIRITNPTPLAEPEQVKLFASPTRELSSNSTLVGEVANITGARKTARIRFSSTSVPTTGSFYLIAQLDSASGDVIGTSVAMKPTRFLAPSVDLSTMILAQPAGPVMVTPSSGAASSAIVKILNGGTVAAVGKFTVTMYASSSTTFDASAVTIGITTFSHARLGAGQSVIIRVPVTLPAGTAFGAYSLFAKVNATTTVAETKLDNNLARSPRALVVENAPTEPVSPRHHHHHFIGGDGGVIYVIGDGSEDTTDDSGDTGGTSDGSDSGSSSGDTSPPTTDPTAQPGGNDFGGGSDSSSGGSFGDGSSSDSGSSDSSGSNSSGSDSSGTDSSGGSDGSAGSDSGGSSGGSDGGDSADSIQAFVQHAKPAGAKPSVRAAVRVTPR